jgi:hypothetical protein
VNESDIPARTRTIVLDAMRYAFAVIYLFFTFLAFAPSSNTGAAMAIEE